MYTSALSSFRRRRVRGLISISFYTYPTSPRGKSNSFESTSREDWILFLPCPIIRTPQSSLRNVFVRRTARLLLKTTLLVSTWRLLSVSLWESSYLMRNNNRLEKGLGGGGGEEGKKTSVAGNAVFGERARRVTFASQNWFKNDEAS